MSDQIQQQLNDLTLAVGRVSAGVNDIKDLQSDVVDLLRKHDRTADRVDQLTAITDRHEKELAEIRKERISAAARREYLQWWISNWKSVSTGVATLIAASLFIYPQAASLLNKIPVA